MNGCYIGRGSLSVSVEGSGRGFFVLSGESEISIEFDEDNESVSDARNGRVERVDWYIRGYRMRVIAQCYRIEKDAIEQLLKATYAVVDTDATPIVLPNPITLGADYLLRPNIVSLTVRDNVGAPVTTYTLDPKWGIINFYSDISPQPYTASLVSAGHTQLALITNPHIIVQAFVKGTNKVTGKEFFAQFYRLAVDITEEMKLVSKEFTAMAVRLQAIPDVSQPLDLTLGQYGKIIQL